MKLKTVRSSALIGAAFLAAGGASAAAATGGNSSHDHAGFVLERSAASVKAGCLANVDAHVRIKNVEGSAARLGP